MRPATPFLLDLESQLKRCELQYWPTAPEERTGLTTKLRFYQGQGDDFVVRGIDSQQGKREGWLWEGRASLVNTDEGHTHNIGFPGTSAVPRYPAETLELRTLLELQA